MTPHTGRKKNIPKPKLLVVDDEPDNLDLLYRTFHRDFNVLRAESGPEALEILSQHGEVAVIISDQRMPSMSGTEFLSLTATQYPDIIRIILTGYTDVDDLVEAINSGKVFKYVTKPWDDEELKNVVRQAVDTHNVLKTRTQELRRTLRQESLVNTVTSAIRGALSSHQILQTIVETLGQMIGADCCVLRPIERGAIASDSYLYVDPSVSAHLNPDLLARTVWEVSEVQDFQLHRSAGDRAPEEVVGELGAMSASDPKAGASSKTEAIQLSPELEQTYHELGIQSSLVVPLSYQSELMAVLALHHIQAAHAWNQDDVQLINLVADQVALALSQARTYEQVKALAKRESLVNMITTVIRSSLDPEDIFAAITQQLGQALHVDGCALSLWTVQDTFVHCVGLYDATQRSEQPVDREPQSSPEGADVSNQSFDTDVVPDVVPDVAADAFGETWISPMVIDGSVGSIGLNSSFPERNTESSSVHHDLHHLPRSVAPIEGNPVLQQLMQSQESVVINNLRLQPELNPMDVPLRSPACALLVVPLIADGQIIGSISLRQIHEPREWQPEEIELAQAVASQAAIAVQQSRLYQTTRQQAEKLMELDRQKTEFFQNISHEFRTPLTLNIGPLESAVVQGSGLSYEQSVIALRNSRRLLRLVNQLLDLQRIDAGRMQATFYPWDLVEFVRQVVDSFRPYCEKRRIDLITRFGECPLLYLDVEKFDKVIYNLLSNAIKFTPAGGRIYVSAWTEGERCFLQVEDTGIGIREDQIPYLFERFRQADGSANRTHEGSGLGLAMVREMIELHGGEVAVESTYGQGTTLTVSLRQGIQHLPPDQISEVPTEIEFRHALIEFADIDSDDDILDDDAAPADDAAIHPSETTLSSESIPAGAADVPIPVTLASASAEMQPETIIFPEEDQQDAAQPKPARHFRILVVDDNPDLRRYVKGILEQGGYQVLTARHGEEGLRVAQQQLPDVILTDLMMPKMSGLEMIQAIRQAEDLRGIPIVLLTAKADEETRIEGTEQGADAYLSKPFNHRELLAEVRNLIALKESERRIVELNTYLTESILKRFLPPSLVDKAAHGKLSLNLRPEPKLVTILFSDIVGFTQLSNTLRSRRVAELLNEYLTEMTHAIFEHGGTVDKFMGDAILAIFGAPEEISPNEQVRRAIASARQMYYALEQLNQRWQQHGIPEVKFRCGIHQGTAVVGMFGSIERSDYTAIGPSVNIAARIQEAADPGSILVSAAVADYLDDTVIQKYSPLKLKGVDETVLTFAIKTRHPE